MTDAREIVTETIRRHRASPAAAVSNWVFHELHAAGFRIVGPEEVDPVTVERCAAIADAEAAKHQGPFTSQPAYVASCAIRDALRALKEKQG